jgi:hypothetical protein
MVARNAIAFIIVARVSIQPCVAADLIPVELRIVVLHITDVEGGTKAADLIGGFPMPPQLSGEEAEGVIARVEKAVKPVRDYRMTVSVDTKLGSKFHAGNKEAYAAGELSFEAIGKSSANVMMDVDLKIPNRRVQTGFDISDGTPGKTFLTKLGRFETAINRPDGTSILETTMILVIARVAEKEGK